MAVRPPRLAAVPATPLHARLPDPPRCAAWPTQRPAVVRHEHVTACLSQHALVSPCSMQERPEDVPTGELPRSISLLVDRHLVGRAAPGTRVKAIGIHTTLAVRAPAHARLQPPGPAVLCLPCPPNTLPARHRAHRCLRRHRTCQ